jgi:hypothetical protein
LTLVSISENGGLVVLGRVLPGGAAVVTLFRLRNNRLAVPASSISVRGGGGPFAPAARLRFAQTPPLRTDRPRVRAHCWSFAFVKPTFRRGVARAEVERSGVAGM